MFLFPSSSFLQKEAYFLFYLSTMSSPFDPPPLLCVSSYGNRDIGINRETEPNPINSNRRSVSIFLLDTHSTTTSYVCEECWVSKLHTPLARASFNPGLFLSGRERVS